MYASHKLFGSLFLGHLKLPSKRPTVVCRAPYRKAGVPGAQRGLPQTVKVETARKAGSCGKDMAATAIGERWCVMRGLSWYFHGSQQFPSQNSSQFCASKEKQHGTSRELEHGP